MSLPCLFDRFTRMTLYINEVVLPAAATIGHPPPLSHRLIALYKQLCIFYFFRCLSISTAMRYHYRPYLDLDITWKYLNHDHVFDSNAILSVSLFCIMSAYIPHITFVSPNPLRCKLAYDLTVTNGRGFFELNHDLCCPYRVPLLKQIWEIIRIFKAKSAIHFCEAKLVYFPSLSNRTRTRLHGWILVLNLAMALVYMTMLTAVSISSFYRIYEVFANEVWYQSLYTAFELVSMDVIFLLVFDCSFMFVIFYCLLAFVYTKQSQIWRSKLSKRLGQQHNLLCQVQLARSFQQFHLEQHRLTGYINQISQTASNRELFMAFCTITSPNAYLLSTLLIRRHFSLVNATLVLGILIGQYVVAGCMLAPMITITSSLHSHRHWLVRLQWILKDKLVLNKLKVASLYEQLNSEKRIGFTVGPLGEVSWSAVFQFSFIYSGFIFFIVNLIRGS